MVRILRLEIRSASTGPGGGGEQDGFSGFSSWPTKRQASPYLARSGSHPRRLSSFLQFAAAWRIGMWEGRTVMAYDRPGGRLLKVLEVGHEDPADAIKEILLEYPELGAWI